MDTVWRKALPDRMFAELLGKEAGYCRGKGGSMHIADPATGNLGANAIVGGSVGIATGAALAAKRLETGRVAVCFFGEGALGQGSLYEVMNLAQLWKLPVIYVCENNLYNEYTHYSETTAGTILGRAAAFGIQAESVDGQDVRAVYESRSSSSTGPAPAKGRRSCRQHVSLTAAITSATSIANTIVRSRKSSTGRRERDPIKLLGDWLIEQNLADRALSRDCRRSRKRRWKRPSSSRWTLPIRLSRGGPGYLCLRPLRELTFAQAVREALAEEMRRDSRVFIFGEDVAEAGTPFKVLSGLVEEFGTERVLDTPISEAGFTGIGVGAAMTGMRPVVDIMFGDFSTLTMDQMVNQAAKVHYMSGGKWKVPMVMRATLGATRRSAAQHSQSLHAWFSHVPGLKVVLPSTPTTRRVC